MNACHERPVALLTGAGRRVGAAIARMLHAAGYDLALHCYQSLTDTQVLVTELEKQRSHSTLLLQADFSDRDAPAELIRQVLASTGRLDALINNASTFFPTPVGQTGLAHWDALMVVNARAPFFLAQAAAGALCKACGSIVNLVDIYAERPLANHPIYCMAKAALLAMSRSLALDMAPNVRVNAVAPGAILWPDKGSNHADQRHLLLRTPLERTGSPEEVAGTVLWLLRDATFVTGTVINVDGGRSLSV